METALPPVHTVTDFDLLVGERLHLGAADCKYAYGLVLPEQRDSQDRPKAEAQRHLAAVWELLSGRHWIVDLD
jgi:hypothetical protein